MKKTISPYYIRTVASKFVAAAVFAISLLSLLSLSSCDDGYWDPDPPYGWNNSFYDSRLNGYWQLVQANSQVISGADTNYLFFNGSGRGVYYYYLNGRRFSEYTAYWCQQSGNGNSRYQINLQYQNGEASTMNYWFEGSDLLWMQWRNQSGVQTYIYRYYPRAPW